MGDTEPESTASQFRTYVGLDEPKSQKKGKLPDSDGDDPETTALPQPVSKSQA